MKIETLVEFSGVPKGTRGQAEKDEELWKITWDLPNFRNKITKKPIQDWFDEYEFKKYLVTIDSK